MGVILAVVDRHAEDAAFLWLQRNDAVSEPHYKLRDLAQHDNRLAAHLDGLLVAKDAGWEVALAGLSSGEPGEVFVAGWLAIAMGSEGKVKIVLEAAKQIDGGMRAFSSALGWHELEDANSCFTSLINTSDEARIMVAVAGSSMHRVAQDGLDFSQLSAVTDAPLSSRAIRAIGELGRKDLLKQLVRFVESTNESQRFWAIWSALRLGDRSLLGRCQAFVNFNSQYALRALNLVLRILPLQESRLWLRGLAQDPELRRYALIGCGVVGDPVYVPSLIKQMWDLGNARVAGEAFCMITGVDLAYEDLDGDWPEAFEAGPTEEAQDEDVAMDEDQFLPWPDQALIQGWWEQHGSQFQPGQRYLCGQPITEENCQRVLREGYQRQRIAAAYELALMDPSAALFEWRAPGFRQQEWLGLK